MLLVCRLCEKQMDNSQQFVVHLKLEHSMNTREYYDMFNEPGKCEVCNMPTTFWNFNKGYRRFCSKKCAMLGTKEDRKQKCLEKYGVENVFQADSVKNKIYQTKLEKYNDPFYTNIEKSISTLQEKYGIDNPAKQKDFNEKRTQTSLERFGTNNPMQSDVVKLIRKENINAKYNVDYYWQTEEFKNKAKETNQIKYNADHYMKSEEYKEKNKAKTITVYNKIIKTGNVIDISNNMVKYRCQICNHDSVMNIQTFSGRLYEKMLNPCINCCPLSKSYSSKEKELLNFVKRKYSGTIVENDRTVLNGKELDIYLPDLKLAFEFDGTYWHADDRFYNVINHPRYNKIKQNEVAKNKLCKQCGIKLIRIKEYDWDNNRQFEEYKIISHLPGNYVDITSKTDFDLYSKLKPHRFYSRKEVKFVCSVCNNISYKSFLYLKYPLICNTCMYRFNAKEIKIFSRSNIETDLKNYIKSIYNGDIDENNRTVLNGKELDIYLPDLKLAFEFDGTYWHADPRFYIATDIIRNKYATTIWEKDFAKNLLCESKGIKLIRIKEYDWKNDNENIKTMILKTINNMIK